MDLDRRCDDLLQQGLQALQVRLSTGAETSVLPMPVLLCALLEAATESLLVTDPEGRVLLVNRTAAQRLGTSPEALMGTLVYDILPPEVAQRRRAIVERLLVSGAVVEFEDVRSDRIMASRVVPIRDPQGRSVAVAIFGRDVTAERQSQARLQESEERYRSVFQNNHAVLLILDAAGGRIVDANPAACRFYGYSLEQLRSLCIHDLNTLTPAEVQAEMDRAQAEGRTCFQFSHRLASGEVRPVEVYSGPVVLDGRPHRYSIVHDISQRRLAEADRERLILELQGALAHVRTLSGLLPICAACKKIRDDQGYWQQIEVYVRDHSEAEFSHGLCPECVERLYPGLLGPRG